MPSNNLMTNDKYNFEDLSSKYGEFKVPTYKVNIDGNDLLSGGSLVLEELIIDLTCENEASGCSFKVLGVYDVIKRCFDQAMMKKFFQIGKKVTIDLGYIKTERVFIGFISAISISVGEQLASVDVECTDVKGLMMNNQSNEQRTETSLGDVVENILKNQTYKNFYASTKVDSIETPERKIEVLGESDFDYLVRLANRINYEFFVLQDIVYFRKPMPYKTPVIELEWGYNLLGFDKRDSLEGQVLELEVRSANADKGEMISGAAKSSIELSQGNSAKKALQKLKKVIVDSSVSSEQEAKTRAQEILKRLNKRYSIANIECVGIPEIVPGRFINIKKLGEGLEGKYYILRVTHNISSGASYSTTIEARMEK